MPADETQASRHTTDDEIPLQQKRPFGSALKRKQVVFVPASTGSLVTTEEGVPAKPARSISNLYLNLVLPKDSATTSKSTDIAEADPLPTALCDVCSLPLNGDAQTVARRHEASIAHQVCLSHSHPPSALDRSRMGLQVLKSQGWDPDARTGLGAQGQGMHYPIKATPKEDTLGIGVRVPKNLPPKKEKPSKLDAGKIRKAAAEDKKRNERLRQELYSSVDLDKYLGG